jgi:methionyl-tRNA formyltransferase
MNILLAGKYFTGEKPLNEDVIIFLKDKKFNIQITEDKLRLEDLKKNNIELIINSGFGPIIKQDIIEIYSNKIINMHNSYLPNGRGIYPNLWSIFCNYQSGISLCYLDKDIDTGDIILRKKINFENENITLKESWMILQKELSKTLIENFSEIIRPSNLKEQSNIKEKPSYHNRKFSEALLNLLPKKWDTPHFEVKQIGKKFDFSYEKFILSL